MHTAMNVLLAGLIFMSIAAYAEDYDVSDQAKQRTYNEQNFVSYEQPVIDRQPAPIAPMQLFDINSPSGYYPSYNPRWGVSATPNPYWVNWTREENIWQKETLKKHPVNKDQ
ncbi:MAG TPA: hypothetical protein P5287_00435 [bacterium]|nr:hypothetical protein [bacterium]